MKGFGMLLLYFFTWRTVLVGSVFCGFALLALAAGVAVYSNDTAGGVSLLAFVFMLAVPYLSAPKALRMIISNRRLALVPGLPLQTGLAMLLLTILCGTFMPFMGWLLGAPEIIFWLGPQIFIVASLYTLVTQMLVTSRYQMLGINFLPLALIVFVSLFDVQLLRLATDRTAISLIAGSAFAGWLGALLILARRRNFKPAYTTDIQNADRETASFLASLFSNRQDQGGLSPTASLLLGYPANYQSRVLNLVLVIVGNPLLAVLLVKFMNRDNGADAQLSATNVFLAMSLFTSVVTGAMAWIETGARARLLWLRIPGTRKQVWEILETELWNYVLLLLMVTTITVALIALVGAGSMLLVHYVLAIFTLTLYQRYLPLAARVNGWSSLTQALLVIASVASIVVTVVYSLRAGNFNIAFLLELCFLLLAVLFRTAAKFGFNRVDWQVLRFTVSKRAAEVS